MSDEQPTLPWFPLWVDDFTGSRRVKLMSLEAVGLFTLLLIEQWRDGPLPDDPEKLAQLVGRDSNAIALPLAEVLGCFQKTPEGLVNKRQEREKEKQLAKRTGRIEAGKRGAQVRWEKGVNGNAIALPLRKHKQPEPEPDTDTTKPSIISLRRSKEKKRVELPEDFQPTDAHRGRAKILGLDVERELEKFTNHAQANARRQVCWNSAFSNWIIKAAEMNPPKPPYIGGGDGLGGTKPRRMY